MADKYTIHRYDHGGGRIFVERDNGSRDLILDLYDDAPGERRDKIIAALQAAEILPPKSQCNVVDV
jgi:hypothetical protein